jgi:hypothetical protein
LAESLPAQFDRFVRDWQTEYKIASEYKLVIADMQSFFIELRNWLEQVELGIRSAPAGDRLQLEREVLDSLAPSVLPCIDALFDRFEAVAGQRAANRGARAPHLHAPPTASVDHVFALCLSHLPEAPRIRRRL